MKIFNIPVGSVIKSSKSIEHSLYLRTLQSFKTRGNIKSHDITEAYIKEILIAQNYKCYYSNLEFTNNSEDKLHYPTIDRIDSSKGYTKDNIVVCGWRVNAMKNDMTVDEFKLIIETLASNISNF